MIFIFFLLHKIESCTITEYRTPCLASGYFTLIQTGSSDCLESYPKSFPLLDCELKCDPGYFSTVFENKLVCRPCPLGTFSVSGVQYGSAGLSWEKAIIDSVSENWIIKKGKKTFTGLPGWQAVDGVGESIFWNQHGQFWNLMYFNIKVVKPGELGIRYQKDSDLVDGVKIGTFKITVNKKLVFEDNGIDFGDWKNFKHDLKAGLNEIILEFTANATMDMMTPKARISSLYISGSAFSDKSCYECPAGGYFEASTSCEDCDFDHYWNQISCEKCPKGTYSFRGSNRVDECKVRPSCNEKDYYFVDSLCMNDKFDRTYQWKEPKICDNEKEKSSNLPNNTKDLPCGTCSAGSSFSSFQNGSTYCSPCENGTYRSAEMEKCLKCPAGEYSESVYEVKTFNTLPKGFSTYCILQRLSRLESGRSFNVGRLKLFRRSATSFKTNCKNYC